MEEKNIACAVMERTHDAWLGSRRIANSVIDRTYFSHEL